MKYAIIFAVTYFITLAWLEAAYGADARCRQLEVLHVQYAGVTLTPAQRALKRTLVAWYRRHCR